MGKALLPWHKRAQIAAIQKGVTVQELADHLGKTRNDISATLHGRAFVKPTAKRISEYLGIQYSEELSPWCKEAKIAMIQKGVTVSELAAYLGKNRSYISTILNGCIYSEPAVKRISDYLGIRDSSETTVLQ